MVNFLTGEAKRRLDSWSEDQFRQAFVDSHRTFVKLALRESKKVSDTEASITYEITYLDQNRGHDARVTNKKLAVLIRQGEKWLIEVSDNGPGFDPSMLESGAARFRRLDTSGSAGLGLAIVEAIVRAHHGSVRLSNTASGGAEVVIELPLMRDGR